MRPLVLCPSCKRHVKGSDAACPFCGSAVLATRNTAGTRARGFPGGRAALFLAGGALAPGCSVETTPQEEVDGGDAATARDGGSDAGHMAVAVYGIAIDSGLVAVPYGIAIPPDAGAADAATTDASCPQVGNLPVPVYGVPVDSGTRTNDCTDAGADAGHDAGLISSPPYGIAIDRDL